MMQEEGEHSRGSEVADEEQRVSERHGRPLPEHRGAALGVQWHAARVRAAQPPTRRPRDLRGE